MVRTYVAPHAVPPADVLQTPVSLLPIPFRDETFIMVPSVPDAPIKLHQALVEVSEVSARHELLQPVPPPQFLPLQELGIRNLPIEKKVLRVLPGGTLADIPHVDHGRVGSRTSTGSRGIRYRCSVCSWYRSLVTHEK